MIALILFPWSILPMVTARMPGPLALLAWNGVGLLLAAPGLRQSLLIGFKGDSFLTLAPHQQMIVAGLACGLLLVGFWGAVRWARRMAGSATSWFGRFAGLALNLSVFAIAYVGIAAAAPQLFYLYYLAIFPELSLQWVVGGPEDLYRVLGALALPADSSLSTIAVAIGFWLGAAATLTVHACALRTDAEPDCGENPT